MAELLLRAPTSGPAAQTGPMASSTDHGRIVRGRVAPATNAATGADPAAQACDAWGARPDRAASTSSAAGARGLLAPPPLPPRDSAAASREQVDHQLRAFSSLCEESQEAFAMGLAAAPPSARQSGLATAQAVPGGSKSSQFLASLGAVHRLNSEQLSFAFALLSLRGKFGQQRTLTALFDHLGRAQASLSQQSIAARQAVNVHHEKARRVQAVRRWVVPAHQAAGLAATGLFLAGSGAAGLILAGIGATVGAVGAVALKTRHERLGGLEMAGVALQGALLGASVAVLGQPLLAWAVAGVAPTFAAFVGASQHAAGKLPYLRAAISATRGSLDLAVASVTARNAWLEAEARRFQAGVDGRRTRGQQLQQLQQAVFDAAQQLVQLRSQSLNQAVRALGRRSEVILRLQASLAH